MSGLGPTVAATALALGVGLPSAPPVEVVDLRGLILQGGKLDAPEGCTVARPLFPLLGADVDGAAFDS